MDDIKQQLKEMDAKLDEHTSILASVDKTLALQAQQLEMHMKRTELAEQNLQLLRDEFKPIQAHVSLMNSVAKIVVFVSIVVSIVYHAYQLLHR